MEYERIYMNKTTIENNDDEIELKAVVDFLKRQFKVMALIFSVGLIITFVYALSKPTIYQSEVTIIIGEKFYFSQPQTIESIDEIKYRYSTENKTVEDKNKYPEIKITQIKGSRLIQIHVTDLTKEDAEKNITTVTNQLLKEHEIVLENKRLEFLKYISLVIKDRLDKNQLLNIFDSASNSNKTRIIGSVKNSTFLHSGRLSQIVGIGFIASLFFAVVIGLIKDWTEKSKADLSANATKPTIT